MRAVGRRAAPLNRPRPPAPEPGLPSGPQPGSKPRYEPPSLRTYQYKHGGLLLPGCARSGGRDPARRATPRRLKHAKVPQTLSLSRYVPRPGQNWSNAACCLAAEAAARPQCRGTGLRDTVPTTAERAGGLGGPRARGARAGRPTRARRLDRREPAGLQSRRDSRRRLCCSRRARAAVGGRGRETGGNYRLGYPPTRTRAAIRISGLSRRPRRRGGSRLLPYRFRPPQSKREPGLAPAVERTRLG